MSEPQFIFIANLLWLDFINTEPILQGEQVDLIGSFEDLVDWLEAAEVLTGEVAQRGRRLSQTGEAEAVLRQAIRLRGSLRDAAERLAAGKSVSEQTVRALNRILASRPTYPQLRRRGKSFSTQLQPVSQAAPHLLVPIAESVAWLLEHGDGSLVRRCENPECVLFFYDTTKNKTRRWCSMDVCGSRAKAMAYYRRKNPLPSS